jgi:hypothetical protein
MARSRRRGDARRVGADILQESGICDVIQIFAFTPSRFRSRLLITIFGQYFTNTPLNRIAITNRDPN